MKISANRKDRSMSQQRGPTTSLSKRGQIVALAKLPENMRLPLWEIAASTNVPISTCSDIIRRSILRIPQTWILDPCSEGNLRPAPTSQKGQNEALTAEGKKNVIALALQDATHCRKSLEELITESGLSISRNTLLNILAADGIHCCHPTKKPYLTAKAKAARLEWALKYQNFNFTKVLFTDKSHFEASTLRSSRARGVLRRAGKEYLAQNQERRFPKESAAMFWGGIMSGYDGFQLPYHFFPSPVETQAQWNASIVRLQQEFQIDTDDYNYFTGLGEPHTVPVHKTRSPKRKEGVDWYIYRDQVLHPKIFPFLFRQMTIRQELLYFMEDGALSHTKDYNVAKALDCGFERITLPPCFPDLNLIEEVWHYIKDMVKRRIGWNYRDPAIRVIVVEEWKALPVDYINGLIASMPRRIAAVIEAEGGNEF